MRWNGQAGCQAVGVITTADATPTLICSVDVSAPGFSPAVDGAGFHVEGVAIGKSSTNAVASVRIAQQFKRIAGSLTLLGTLLPIVGGAGGTLLGDAGLLTALATLQVSSNAIVLRATGIAATSIQWTGFLYIWSSDI